jgi:hypothetical protein
MKKAGTMFIKNLRYLCLVGVIAIGLMTIVGTGGVGGGGGETPSNTPPTASITSPTDGSAYTQGDTISFSGTGEDAEDGTLSGASLLWTSSIDDQIGTGTSFTRDDLSAGTHTITLTATDSEEATGSDSVSITISSEAYVETFPIPDAIQPYLEGIEHDGTYLWASVSRLAPEVRVYEIDPPDGTILRSYLQNHYNPASSNVIGLAYDSANNLIYNHVYPYGPIYAVDASTLVEVSGSSISAPASWIHDIAFDSDNQILWAVTGDAIHANYRIYKIRPSDGSFIGSFTTPTNAPNPSGLAWDGTYLWVADSDQNLYQINQNQALVDGNCNNSILQEFYMPDLGVPVGRLAWDGSFLWTASSADGLFYKIDVGNLP